MVSLTLAQQLKENGVQWQPQTHDCFAIPDRGFEDQYFVINEMAVIVEKIKGHPAITFHGTPEWAADYIMITELVWLPTETQIRQLLERRLRGEPEPKLILSSTAHGYRCKINFLGEQHRFDGFGASEVYALALLHILQLRHRKND